MSTAPSAASARSTIARTASGSPTSAAAMHGVPPSRLTSSAVSSSAAECSRPLSTTLAPARANASAMPRPMLRAEPVTNAVRPASGRSCIASSGSGTWLDGLIARRLLPYASQAGVDRLASALEACQQLGDAHAGEDEGGTGTEHTGRVELPRVVLDEKADAPIRRDDLAEDGRGCRVAHRDAHAGENPRLCRRDDDLGCDLPPVRPHDLQRFDEVGIDVANAVERGE